MTIHTSALIFLIRHYRFFFKRSQIALIDAHNIPSLVARFYQAISNMRINLVGCNVNGKRPVTNSFRVSIIPHRHNDIQFFSFGRCQQIAPFFQWNLYFIISPNCDQLDLFHYKFRLNSLCFFHFKVQRSNVIGNNNRCIIRENIRKTVCLFFGFFHRVTSSKQRKT